MIMRQSFGRAPARVILFRAARPIGRVLIVLMLASTALLAISVGRSATAAPGRLIAPNEAFSIAAGLTDAAGDLGLQCLLAKVGDRVRGGSPTTRVASTAVKASLDFAQAKKGCGAMVETLKAVAVIVALAELDQPAWIGLEQSTKNRILRPDECTAVIYAGPSESLALKFTAKFTC